MCKLITILLPNLGGGGAERVNLDLAHAFSRLGHSVEFVLMRAEGVFLPEAETSFSVVELGITRGRQVPWAFARYLQQRRPDAVVVSMWPLTTSAVFARLLSRHACKLLLVEHSTLSFQYKGWGWLHSLALRVSQAIGCRLADAVAGVSQGVTDDLAKLAWVSSGRLNVLYNPIPLRPLPSEAAIAEVQTLWRPLSGAKILTVGSFKKVKNYPLLLHAFARMVQQTDAQLMLLGEGAMRVELEALAKTLGITDRVIFPGFYRDTTPFYKTADLFVLSSNREGLPTVLIEALASGLPVVSTDCPSGPAEILVNGKYGTLVPVDDEQALVDAMLSSLKEQYDTAALKRRAMDFSPDKIAKQYLELMFPDDNQSITCKDKSA